MFDSWIREHHVEDIFNEGMWFLEFNICIKKNYDVQSEDLFFFFFFQEQTVGVFSQVIFNGIDLSMKKNIGERLLNFSIKILGNIFI